MSTKEARTRATRAWRERKQEKLVQAYLHTDTVAQLDALVQTRGATGRAAVLADLIEAAHEAMAAAVGPPAPAADTTPAPRPESPAPKRRLARSSAHGWKWDILIDEKPVARVKPPELRGGDWAGMLIATPDASNRKYRATRGELVNLLVKLAS